MQQYKEIAFGPLNLSVSQYWQSTPREINDLFVGFKWRDDREWDRAAWIASKIISIFTKKPVSPSKLLGKENKPTKQEKKKTAEQLRAEHRNIMVNLERAKSGEKHIN